MTEAATTFIIPDGIYALSHSVGCLPRTARAALDEAYLNPWSLRGGGAWPDWLNAVNKFCDALADLFNSQPSSFCPQPSVSDGFYNLLTALPDARGKRVLMHAEAFPSLGFVVHGLKAQGFELMLADGPAEQISTWEMALSDDIDIALITHAHSNTGKLSPAGDIAKLCRQRGIISIVDVAQSAGVIPIDFRGWGADGVVGSCVKWLCGGPGAGWLWVSDILLPELRPQRIGWFSHEDPFEFDITDFRPAGSALKFWGGTPTVAPYALARSGIETIAGFGVEAARAHNLKLMRSCLDAAGLSSRPLDPKVNTGTLCLSVPQSQIADAKAALDGVGCHHDWRGQTVRLSFHIFNSEDEAASVGTALSPFMS
jgi:kynureninase